LGSCPDCAQPNSPGHDEKCHGKANQRLARHEILKKRFASAVKEAGSNCSLEPFVQKNNSGLRVDLSITGPAASNGTAILADLSLISVCSKASRSLPQPPSEVQETRFSRASREIRLILETRAQVKIGKYSSKCDVEFVPLVLTTGGSLHFGLSHLMGCLKKAGCKISKLRRDISLTLIRSRAVNYQF
jgi:hypothetical protein